MALQSSAILTKVLPWKEAGVGFLKNLVPNILFQMKARSSDVFQTTSLPSKAEAALQRERNAETFDRFQDVFLGLLMLFLLKRAGHIYLYLLRKQYPLMHHLGLQISPYLERSSKYCKCLLLLLQNQLNQRYKRVYYQQVYLKTTFSSHNLNSCELIAADNKQYVAKLKSCPCSFVIFHIIIFLYSLLPNQYDQYHGAIFQQAQIGSRPNNTFGLTERSSEKSITVSDDLLLLSFQPNLCLPLMLFIVVRFC